MLDEEKKCKKCQKKVYLKKKSGALYSGIYSSGPAASDLFESIYFFVCVGSAIVIRM